MTEPAAQAARVERAPAVLAARVLALVAPVQEPEQGQAVAPVQGRALAEQVLALPEARPMRRGIPMQSSGSRAIS